MARFIAGPQAMSPNVATFGTVEKRKAFLASEREKIAECLNGEPFKNGGFPEPKHRTGYWKQRKIADGEI